ncbi:STAS domain-containing protein [Actinoplanes sp. NPDC026623]|uniref:STAS domain-containing protein n=1 Tax=Actinoplanes sp. NPDC026623 TaxID=3155610 RepID=UPI003401D2D4
MDAQAYCHPVIPGWLVQALRPDERNRAALTAAPPADRVSLHHLLRCRTGAGRRGRGPGFGVPLERCARGGSRPHPRVIVDLARAGTVDSVGLSTLLAALRTACREGGDLLLAAPSGLMLDVLHASRLDTAFTTFGTVPQAMTAARVMAYPAGTGADHRGRPRAADQRPGVGSRSIVNT